MDQQLTSDGKPYAPIRYKELVQECYLISKHINTSYIDVLKITPIERKYIFEFLTAEAEQEKAYYDKLRADRDANSKTR